MMKKILTKLGLAPLALAAGLSTAGMAHAGEIVNNPDAVLELFTSQGCHSCPPADKLLQELAEKRDDIIALAYHVDYWDYIGWKDTFASPEFTKRQRAYGAVFDDSVYTPQLVVNGRVGMVGSRRNEVNRALSQIKSGDLAKPHVPVTLTAEKDMLHIDVAAHTQNANPATVWAVTFSKTASVDIKRGENRGRTIQYSHIVRAKTPLGMLASSDEQHYQLLVNDLLGDNVDGVAILVQEDLNGRPGPIIGSALYTK